MSVCEDCGQQMRTGVGCTVHGLVFLDGVSMERVRYGSETHATLRLQRELGPEQARAMEWIGPKADAPWEDVLAALHADARERPCPDCAVTVGQFHHPGCDIEECPRCHRQMLSCECPPPTGEPLTVTVTLEVQVDESAWARVYARSDEYDRAEVARGRSLVADVRDYALGCVAQSAAATEGAIVDVELVV